MSVCVSVLEDLNCRKIKKATRSDERVACFVAADQYL